MYEKILGEIAARYSLGYLSTNKKMDGTWRDVKVRILRDRLEGRQDPYPRRVLRPVQGLRGPAVTESRRERIHTETNERRRNGERHVVVTAERAGRDPRDLSSPCVFVPPFLRVRPVPSVRSVLSPWYDQGLP